MMASVTVQSRNERTHFASVFMNDGSVEWVDFSILRRRVEAMELVDKWLKGEVDGVYLGRRDS